MNIRPSFIAKGIFLALLVQGALETGLGMPPTAQAAKLSRSRSQASITSPALRQGIAYFNKGYIQKSIPQFRQATLAAPKDPNAQLWLARALTKQGGETNLKAAQSAYRQVLTLNPNQLEALLTLGEVLSWETSTRTDALTLLKRAWEVSPTSSPERVKAAKLLMETLQWEGRTAEALPYADELAQARKSDKKFLSSYASLLAQQPSRAGEALPIFENQLAIQKSSDFDMVLSYGLALVENDQTTKANDVFEALNSRLKDLPESKQSDHKKTLYRKEALAGFAYELGRYADAIALDQSLPTTLPNHMAIRHRIARSYAKSGRVPEAIDAFQSLYKEGNLNAEEKIEYADFLVNQQLSPEALPEKNLVETLYQEAYTGSPSQGSVVLIRLARITGKQPERFNEAFTLYLKALESDPEHQPLIKQETLNFLQASANNPSANVEEAFQKLKTRFPADPSIESGYAEYLSWNENTRERSIRAYLGLIQSDAANKEKYLEGLEQVLGWHQPNLKLIPLYEEVLSVLPTSKGASLSMARAYRLEEKNYGKALSLYANLANQYPNDKLIQREWVDLLASKTGNQKEALKVLKAQLDTNPDDTTTKVTYGRVLSYQRQYKKATDIFDQVLASNPDNRDALVGKGYVLLWSGRRYAALKFLENARKRFPEDVEMIYALAETEKSIGRYDRALELMEEVKIRLKAVEKSAFLPSRAPIATSAKFVLCSQETLVSNSFSKNLVFDFDANRVSNALAQPVKIAAVPAPPKAAVSKSTPVSEADVSKLDQEMAILDKTIESLQALQDSTNKQLNVMESRVNDLHEASLEDGQSVGMSSSVQQQEAPMALMNGNTAQQDTPEYFSFASEEAQEALAAEEEYTTQLALQNFLLTETSGQVGHLNLYTQGASQSLQKNLDLTLRPRIQFGASFLRQQGERSTVALRGYGFPNQISLSLTPNIRIRGGVTPENMYIPNVPFSPRRTWGTAYGVGATAKVTDRLTLDGDVALTHYYQSGTENFTFQSRALYDVNDYVGLKFGVRRLANPNSLLSLAGFTPNVGAFRDQFIGQARENGIYGELNLKPVRNVDFNLGYEWAFVDGKKIATNYRNQIFSSLGYTVPLGQNHTARLAYQFLWFGYSKNATTGFVDVIGNTTTPVSSLLPVTPASPNVVFGGYYSPEYFFLNSLRLDLNGSFLKKFLEYHVGGSIGVQTAGNQRGVNGSTPTTLATAFDGVVTANWTDWFATYGNVDFIDAGGLFQRWRFGGGVILRPNVPALSPVFGRN